MVRRSTIEAWPADESARVDLVPRRHRGVRGVEIDDESVLYDERDGRLHLLNWSASAVWWSIDGIATVDTLAVDLANRFHADPDAMRTDVITLLDVLGAQQLIVAVQPARSGSNHA
jgi:hypothetical protein